MTAQTTMNKLNERIQWLGTLFILAMYVIMSYYPELHPYNIMMGLLGGLCYFTWTVRVRNYPQMLINAVAILLCVGGLIKYYT